MSDSMKLAFLLFAILVTTVASSAPGDTLFVQGNIVNMREGPSTSEPVVLKLEKGHELVEFQTMGEWVEVGASRTDGKTGWIHSSLIGSDFSGGSTAAPEDPKFDQFLEAFDKLNERAENLAGVELFTGAENLGDGIIQVTATDVWLNASVSDRESNLNTIYKLWEAADGTGLPIAVYVVNKNGDMKMAKNK